MSKSSKALLKAEIQKNQQKNSAELSKIEAEEAGILMEIGRCDVQVDIISQQKYQLKKKLLEVNGKREAIGK